MKTSVAYVLMIAGAVLTILFSYASYGFITSHPLLRWTVFAESLAFSIALVLLGLVLLGVGVSYNKKLKKLKH